MRDALELLRLQLIEASTDQRRRWRARRHDDVARTNNMLLSFAAADMYYRIQCTVNNNGKKPITKSVALQDYLSLRIRQGGE